MQDDLYEGHTGNPVSLNQDRATLLLNQDRVKF